MAKVNYGFTQEELSFVLKKYVRPEDWDKFLQQNKEQLTLLQKGYTAFLDGMTTKESNNPQQYAARIQLRRVTNKETGKQYIQPAFLRFANTELRVPETLTLDGVKIHFSEQQIKQLTEDGRLTETLKYTGREGTQREIFVAVDQQCKALAFAPATTFRPPNQLYGALLSDQQKAELQNGQKIHVEIYAKGTDAKKTLSAYYDPATLAIRFEDPNKTTVVTQKEEPAKKVTITPSLEEVRKEAQVTQQHTKIGKSKGTGLPV